jgi:hypothetical protein
VPKTLSPMVTTYLQRWKLGEAFTFAVN